ncbi:MAG: glycosyltransferase family 4 protein [Chloroflexi bacterium]|nr:glycosyltransferase family 4 protein [Chloroflexota bacterium]MBV9595285.1 glycosyltransferase family 4 protein [Chloroflexota bacterium]
MKIGFDVSQTGRLKAGCGYFADSLIQHLVKETVDEYVLYPTFGDNVWDEEWPTATRFFSDRWNVHRGLGHRSSEDLEAFWRNPPDDLDEQLGQPDIVHANNFYCPTRLRRARIVYTLHDLAFTVYPEWTTEVNRTACFSGVFNASLYADHIVANSEYTRRHFLETFPHYPPQRISVVYPGSRFTGPAQPTRPATLPYLEAGQFWLTVGTVEPRKNYIRLLQAYARLRASVANCQPLVLVGGKGWLMHELDVYLEEFGLLGSVVYLGYVDDETLQWLYENCLAFCYPSLFEGFGMPVAEAMSLGAATIVSDATSLPEIAGGAGLLVDPEDTEQIASAMRTLAENSALRTSIQHKVLEACKRFTWERAAARVSDIYRAVLEHPAFESRV